MSTQITLKPPSGIDPKPEELSGYAGWWLLVIAVCSAIALAVIYWWGWRVPKASKPEQLGQMGDYFGGLLNPLVSTLTLFVAISVWRLQKKEVEETRKALEEQAKTAEQQRQEQRFFDLLNVYQQTVGAIFVVARMPSTSGEPPRFLRRLFSLRGLSHDEGKQVFTRGTRTRCSHGAGTQRAVPIAVGGH